MGIKLAPKKQQSIFGDIGLSVRDEPVPTFVQTLEQFPRMNIGKRRRFKNLVSIETHEV